MFAPPVRKAKTKAPESPSKGLAGPRPSIVAHQPDHCAGELRMLQNTPGSLATTRFLTQRAETLKGNQRAGAQFVQEVKGLVPLGPSWDFSKITIFPPDRENRPDIRAVPVSRPGDPLELDANAVAARLLAGMDPAGGGARVGHGLPVDAVQSQVESDRLNNAHCCRGTRASATLADLPRANSPLGSRFAGRYGEGQPLNPSIRRAAEPLLGYDLGGVRVHPHEASEMAEAVAARAFTVGRHIYFGKGEYNPGTREGMTILLHELAHTTQPGGEIIQRWPRITRWDFRHSKGESKSPDNCAPIMASHAFALGVDSKFYGPDSFTNGMELRAHIEGHEAGVTYDIKRIAEIGAWERDGGTWTPAHKPPFLDDPDNDDECLTPSPPPDRYIYSADAPGLANTDDADPAATEMVIKHTFFEWVDMERWIGVGVESTNTYPWHSIIWLKKGATAWQMDKTRSEIAPGKIKVDTPTP